MPLYDNADKRARRRQESACTTSHPCSASVHRIACLDTLLLTLLILALLIAFGSATGFHGWLRKTDVTKFKDGLRVLVTNHDGAVLDHIQQQQQEEEVLRGSVLPGRKLLVKSEQNGSGSSRLRGSKAPAVTIPASSSSQVADAKDNTPIINKLIEGGSQIAGAPKHVVLKWSGPEYDPKTNSTYIVLVNVGSETVQWEVVDDPRWLDVVPAQGKLQPKTLKRLSLDLVAKVLPTVSGTVRIRGELPSDKHFGELAIPLTASVFSSSRSQGFIDRSTESLAQHTAEPIQQSSVTTTADAPESSPNTITPADALEGAQPAASPAAEAESRADGPAGNENQTLLALNATVQPASILIASSIAVPQEEPGLNATASRSTDMQAKADTPRTDNRQTEIVTAADDAVLPEATERAEGASDPLQALEEADVDDFRQVLGSKSGQGIGGVVQPAEAEAGGSQLEEARNAGDAVAPSATAPAMGPATEQQPASLEVEANNAVVDANIAADVVQVSAKPLEAVVASVPVPAPDGETITLASAVTEASVEEGKPATDVAPAKEAADDLHVVNSAHGAQRVEVDTSEEQLSSEREVTRVVDVPGDADNDIQLFAAIPDDVLDEKPDEFDEVSRDENADLVNELDARDSDRLHIDDYAANSRLADAQQKAKEFIDDRFDVDEEEPEVEGGKEQLAARSDDHVVVEEQPRLERLSPQQQKDMQRELHSYMWAVGGVSTLVYVVAGLCGAIFLFLIFRRWSRSSIARRLTYHEKLTPPPSSHRGNQPGRRFSDRGTPTGWNASWKDDSWDNTDS
eukprot:jgi/Chlat1/2966/Chrsp2S08913